MLKGIHFLKLDRKKVLRNKRSDGRLKRYNSCSDERAWTLDKYERQRYIRDLVAAPYDSSTTESKESIYSGKKLPLFMLLGPLLSLKNVNENKLKKKIEELNNDLQKCREELHSDVNEPNIGYEYIFQDYDLFEERYESLVKYQELSQKEKIMTKEHERDRQPIPEGNATASAGRTMEMEDFNNENFYDAQECQPIDNRNNTDKQIEQVIRKEDYTKGHTYIKGTDHNEKSSTNEMLIGSENGEYSITNATQNDKKQDIPLSETQTENNSKIKIASSREQSESSKRFSSNAKYSVSAQDKEILSTNRTMEENPHYVYHRQFRVRSKTEIKPRRAENNYTEYGMPQDPDFARRTHPIIPEAVPSNFYPTKKCPTCGREFTPQRTKHYPQEYSFPQNRNKTTKTQPDPSYYHLGPSRIIPTKCQPKRYEDYLQESSIENYLNATRNPQFIISETNSPYFYAEESNSNSPTEFVPKRAEQYSQKYFTTNNLTTERNTHPITSGADPSYSYFRQTNTNRKEFIPQRTPLYRMPEHIKGRPGPTMPESHGSYAFSRLYRTRSKNTFTPNRVQLGYQQYTIPLKPNLRYYYPHDTYYTSFYNTSPQQRFVNAYQTQPEIRHSGQERSMFW